MLSRAISLDGIYLAQPLSLSVSSYREREYVNDEMTTLRILGAKTKIVYESFVTID